MTMTATTCPGRWTTAPLPDIDHIEVTTEDLHAQEVRVQALEAAVLAATTGEEAERVYLHNMLNAERLVRTVLRMRCRGR